MRNVIFFFTLLLWSAQSLSAQSEARFYAKASDTEVAVGEPVRISFVLENGKGNGRFTPPDWEAAGFMLLGSSQSSSISFTNGESTATASYDYTITPMEAGTLSIPSVSIKNGSGELRTEAIAIQALPNADGSSPKAPKRSPAQPQSQPKRSFKTIKM